MFVTEFIAASAVWMSDMPSLALRAAWLALRMLACSFELMARPAASSLALVMRMPDERRAIALSVAVCDAVRLRCALSEARFVRIDRDIRVLLWGEATRCRSPLSPVSSTRGRHPIREAQRR